MNTVSLAESRPSALPGYLLVLPWQLAVIGGVNRIVREVYMGLASIGRVRPQILISLWDPQSLVPCVGFELHSLRLRTPGSWGENWRYVLTFPGTLIRLRQLIATENIKVINAHYPSLYCLTFLFASRVFGVRLFLSFHGEDLKGALVTQGLNRWLWKVLLSGATRLVASAQSQADLIAAFHPKLRDRIDVIYNGVDASAFVEAGSRARPEVPPGAYVLMVGIFEFRKGYDVLFPVWERIRDRHPDLSLVIVGSGGPDAAWVREHAKQASGVMLLEDQSVDSVSKLMSGAILMVLPSRAETFPLVLLEAGAHALPVIASAVDGVPELIQDGVNGLLVAPGNPESLFLAMERLIADPSLARQFGNSLQNRVRSEFTWLRTVRAYQKLIDA
jgi:glycosyltransferase involved in cell wall biosynthesis